MCGIVVALSAQRPTPLSTVVAMTTALRHRGPDDEGYAMLDGERMRRFWGVDTPKLVRSTVTSSQPEANADAAAAVASRLVLGHRRLAIVDLSPLGHQPEYVRGNHLHAVFNGEIYNHIELRAELQAQGHAFESHSDTEVLLAAYEHWGQQAWARLNGMWAIAIHDARRRSLVIARDRFGVKPLYVWSGPQGVLLLASEIKALLAHPDVRTQAEPAACAQFAISGPTTWRDDTMFVGIRDFPAGHWAEVPVDAAGRLNPVPYWSAPDVDPGALHVPFDAATADRLADEYRSLLDDAVRVRMRMDVRFGTALSGGLDHSQIAARVNAELRRRGVRERQEVFSSVYKGQAREPSRDTAYGQLLRRADESAFVAATAKRLDVASNTIEPRWQDIPAAHERLIWALDSPPANTLMSSWHTYALVARCGVIVTLDGQGADEQLAGYLRYLRNHLVHGQPLEALREAWVLRRHTRGADRTRSCPDSRATGSDAWPGHADWTRCRVALRALTVRQATFPDALRRDFATELQNLLHYADQSAMAWSVESRYALHGLAPGDVPGPRSVVLSHPRWLDQVVGAPRGAR